MDESLMERRRVVDEALRSVKTFCQGESLLIVLGEYEVAKLVPAAAVIRVPQALSGIIGRKGCVGGRVSLPLNSSAQPGACGGNGAT